LMFGFYIMNRPIALWLVNLT